MWGDANTGDGGAWTHGAAVGIGSVLERLAQLAPDAKKQGGDEGYPCCDGLDAEDLVSAVDNPALREVLLALLRFSTVAPLLPIAVRAAASEHLAEVDSDDDLAVLLCTFLDGVGAKLGPALGPTAVAFTLLDLGRGPESARAQLRLAHDAVFDELVEKATEAGLIRPLENGLHRGIRDLSHDGLRAYLLLWSANPTGRQTCRARGLLSAALADMLTSHILKKLPVAFRSLEHDLSKAVRGFRIPFVPLRPTQIVRFAYRVVTRSLDEAD